MKQRMEVASPFLGMDHSFRSRIDIQGDPRNRPVTLLEGMGYA